MPIPFGSIHLLPLYSDRLACTLGKSDRRVDVVLRQRRRGTELRCLHEGTLLWTEMISIGPDHSSAVQRAVDDTRAAWEAKGWRCACVGAVEPQRPRTA
jgi:hypothetical protein